MSKTDNLLDDDPVPGKSTIDRLLEGIPIPRMVKAHQTFDRPRVADVESELIRKFRASGVLAKVKPGHQIGITAGSRGITSLPLMLKILVAEIKRVGGELYSLTSTVPASVKIPMVLSNDRQAIQAAIKTCNILDKSKVRPVRIKNTVALDEIAVSENLLPEVRENKHLQALGEPQALAFNDRGSLF